MISYRIMIEGVFVHAPELEGRVGGFHTTFFLSANNADNAVIRASKLLSERMHNHEVTGRERGLLRTYCWVHDLWEVAEESPSQRQNGDSGFTFFRIGPLERFYLGLRRLFFQRYKPWLLVAQAV